MEPYTVTNQRFARVRRARPATSPRPSATAGRSSSPAACRTTSGRPARWPSAPWWRAVPGASWRAPDGPGSRRAPDHPGRARLARRRAGVLRLGGRARCRPRPSGSPPPARASTARYPWGDEWDSAARELVPRRLPARPGRHRPGRRLRAERARPAQRRRQRLGVDGRARRCAAAPTSATRPTAPATSSPAAPTATRRWATSASAFPKGTKGCPVSLRRWRSGSSGTRAWRSRRSRSGRG